MWRGFASSKEKEFKKHLEAARKNYILNNNSDLDRLLKEKDVSECESDKINTSENEQQDPNFSSDSGIGSDNDWFCTNWFIYEWRLKFSKLSNKYIHEREL